MSGTLSFHSVNEKEAAVASGLDDVIAAETALSDVDGADESAFTDFTIDKSKLVKSKFVNGKNVLAVEVHQFNRVSPDLSFDLALLAQP